MFSHWLPVALALIFASDTAPQSQAIEERFLAPCCWRENLAAHRSPEAEAMRAELRQLLESGKTEDEIVAFYVAKYGQRILREPQGDQAVWLQVIPILGIAAGVLLVAGYIVHARRRVPQLTPETGPVPDDEDWA